MKTFPILLAVIFFASAAGEAYSPEAVSGPHEVLVFRDGGVLPGHLFAVQMDVAEVDTLDGAETRRVPVESLAGIVFVPPTTQEAWDALWKNILETHREAENDRFRLRNEDRMTGFFLKMEDGIITFRKTDAEEEMILEIPVERVMTVIFAGKMEN